MAPITSSNRCVHCGAPLTGDDGRRCSYCNVVQPAEAPVAAPGAPIAPVVAGAAAAVLLGVVVVVWALREPSRPARVESAPPPVVTATAPPPPTTAAAIEAPSPSAIPVATARTSAAVRPAPKLTNEQFGKNVVAAQSKKLRGCVEQDLVRNPSAPKAYTVTVLVEKDGLPRSSATTFSPTPTEGFAQCARHVILYGFSGYGRNPPELVEFTFSTSFAFPDAKPAAKAESGRGWD